MHFKDIPDHEEVKKQLIRSVQEDRTAHAQLILGSTSTGTLALTLAYVAYILCLDREDDDSCGHCRACNKSHKLIHPDVHFAFPVIGIKDKLRKDVTSSDFLNTWRASVLENPYLDMNLWMQIIQSENKQPDINVTECVEIIKKLGLKTFESEYKIQIIWMPEYLGKEGNRLLKLIEEPTDNTLILLIAENRERILNTILSRTQVTYIHQIDQEALSNYLIHKKEVAPGTAHDIARIADGDINLALHLLDNDYRDYSELLLDWLRLCYKGDPVGLKHWIDDVYTWSKEEQKHFFRYGIMFFREYLYSLVIGQMSPKFTQKEMDTVEKMQTIIDANKAESIVNIFSEAIDNVSRNVNIKIMLMSDSLTVGLLLKSAEKVVTLYKI